MHGYDPAGWGDFFTAVTSAAAALTGLLFVAVSINLENILKVTGLPERAAQTLAMLLFVVLSSALTLVPQDIELLGAEVLVMVVPLTWITLRGTLKYRRQNPDTPLLWSVSRATANAVALVPGTIAGSPWPRTGAAACTGSCRPPCSASSAPSTAPGSCWSRSSGSAAVGGTPAGRARQVRFGHRGMPR